MGNLNSEELLIIIIIAFPDSGQNKIIDQVFSDIRFTGTHLCRR